MIVHYRAVWRHTTLAAFCALLLVGCAAGPSSLVLANRQRAERRPAVLAQANAIRHLAAEDCRRQVEERAKDYQQPAACFLCGPGDELMRYVDELWAGAVTEKWYTGGSPPPGYNPTVVYIRNQLLQLFPQSSPIVDAIARVAPKHGRVRQGSLASILITEASEGCRGALGGTTPGTLRGATTCVAANPLCATGDIPRGLCCWTGCDGQLVCDGQERSE